MEQAERQADIFDAVFEYAEVGMAVLDARGTLHRANETLARFLGWAPGELVGCDLFDSVPPSERHLARGILDALVVHGRRSVRSEQRFTRSDGKSVWALVTYSVATSSEGQPITLVAIIDDITAEREALRSEREREQSVRRAYADVVSAMTGGRLLIVPIEELPDQLGERVLGPLSFHDEAGPGEIRHAMHEFATEHLKELSWESGFEVALGEALLNALKHAGGGAASLHVCNDVLQAVIEDKGPGIDFGVVAPASDEGGYDRVHTLGVGFTLILSFTSRILLASGREGTTVVLEGHNGGPDQTLPD